MGDYWKLGQQFRAISYAPESFRYFLEQQKYPALLVDLHLNLIAMNTDAQFFLSQDENEIINKNNMLYVKNKQGMTALKQKIAIMADNTADDDKTSEVRVYLNELVLTCVLLGNGRDVVGLDTAVRFILIQPNDIRTTSSSYPIWETPGLTRRESELVEILATGAGSLILCENIIWQKYFTYTLEPCEKEIESKRQV